MSESLSEAAIKDPGRVRLGGMSPSLPEAVRPIKTSGGGKAG